MPAPWNCLQLKTEEALKSVIDTDTTLTQRGDASVYTALSTGTLALPAVVVEAGSGDEHPWSSGNFNVDCEVKVFSSADPKVPATLAAHRSRTGYVMDAVMNGTLADDLTSAVSDFTCFGVVSRSLLPEARDDRHMISGMRLRLYCAPSNLVDGDLLTTQAGVHFATQAGEHFAVL